MGRRSVWSQPELIRLAQRFHPVADEVWRLQRGTDAECRTFQAMADQGHYGRGGGTRQGIYVCTPRGGFLGSLNSNDPRQVQAMMRDAWRSWEELPDEERWIETPETLAPEGRWEEQCPEDGLVLRSVVRDLPSPASPADEFRRWNQDRVWYSAEEARRWLPDDPRPGVRHALPRDLGLRLARFHLVDAARGQTVPFAEAEVEEVALEVRVTARTGSRVELAIEGHTRAHAPGPWMMGDNDFRPANGQEYVHGLAASLRGSAAFDLDAGRFIAFELLARCERWGRTENNGRAGRESGSPLGILFHLLPEGASPASRHLPPAFFEVYDAPWKRSGAPR